MHIKENYNNYRHNERIGKQADHKNILQSKKGDFTILYSNEKQQKVIDELVEKARLLEIEKLKSNKTFYNSKKEQFNKKGEARLKKIATKETFLTVSNRVKDGERSFIFHLPELKPNISQEEKKELASNYFDNLVKKMNKAHNPLSVSIHCDEKGSPHLHYTTKNYAVIDNKIIGKDKQEKIILNEIPEKYQLKKNKKGNYQGIDNLERMLKNEFLQEHKEDISKEWKKDFIKKTQNIDHRARFSLSQKEYEQFQEIEQREANVSKIEALQDKEWNSINKERDKIEKQGIEQANQFANERIQFNKEKKQFDKDKEELQKQQAQLLEQQQQLEEDRKALKQKQHYEQELKRIQEQIEEELQKAEENNIGIKPVKEYKEDKEELIQTDKGLSM